MTIRTGPSQDSQSPPPHPVAPGPAANESVAGSADRLAASVIAGGYCIGCGGCSAGRDAAFSIAFDRNGFLQAVKTGPDRGGVDYLALCPFSGASRNESELAFARFGDMTHDARIGHHLGVYAGNLVEEADRERGSSGGLTSWVLRELLARHIVDHVVHVRPVDPRTQPAGQMFQYAISSTVDELNAGRGSHYYPIEISGVIEEMRRRPGRYAVVAIPCFAKTVRLAAAQDPVLNERIAVVVGLVCGHLKSRYFADYLGWLVGVRPTDLLGMNFRRKLTGVMASQYTVAATGRSRVRAGAPVEEYFGTSWDLGFFKYKACDFCDDVFAETADIVMGDAWIEPYSHDWRGTNIVVVRRADLDEMLHLGCTRGEITLERMSVDDAARSQAAGLRHRRDGLAVRLKRLDERCIWRPRKRFEEIAPVVDGRRRYIYIARERLASQSTGAFRVARGAGVLNLFYAAMSLPVFAFFLRRESLHRAVRETVPVKWLRRMLRRRRRAATLRRNITDQSALTGE